MAGGSCVRQTVVYGKAAGRTYAAPTARLRFNAATIWKTAREGYLFHSNGNNAFCLSMANTLSRVMMRVVVTVDSSTLLPCPASSL